MKICLCTVIKNEQEYLDEWIRYHLDMGINHIFIFEDIDSDSHISITNNYEKSVSLASINSTLTDDEKKEALSLKETKRYNAQHLYFRRVLNYIKDNFSSEYDLCFAIDSDEFIALENSNDSLPDVLSLYRDYDAVILKWKCYGANGIISKPDYTNSGVVDTYTSEAIGEVPDTKNSFMKTCYNLKRYSPDFFFNQHHPSYKCNWVNTDFKKNWIYSTFHNIYIKHYITKSWEEYTNKLTQRGFVWGGKRNFNFFFAINPELIPVREELINSLEKEILVVLPYVQNGAQGNEIKLALKLWKKFCKFKYHFVVIGDFNQSLRDEFPWVEFIDCKTKEKKDGQYNPHLDVQNKMEIILNRFPEYGGFIRMMDDIYAIKEFNFEDILTTHYHSRSFSGDRNKPTWFWIHDKWKTRVLLDKERLPHINYATHYPSYFEFSKLIEIWDKFGMRDESYVYEDVYFNYFTHDPPVLDSAIRLGIWNKTIYDTCFEGAFKNPCIKFVCNSVDGWSKDLENRLDEI